MLPVSSMSNTFPDVRSYEVGAVFRLSTSIQRHGYPVAVGLLRNARCSSCAELSGNRELLKPGSKRDVVKKNLRSYISSTIAMGSPELSP